MLVPEPAPAESRLSPAGFPCRQSPESADFAQPTRVPVFAAKSEALPHLSGDAAHPSHQQSQDRSPRNGVYLGLFCFLGPSRLAYVNYGSPTSLFQE